MNEQQIAAVKQALEALELKCPTFATIVRTGIDDKRDAAITALRHILADQALDKKAENARELGLDYEPVARVAGYHSGFPVIEPLNPRMVMPMNMALYTHPVNQVAEPRNMDEIQRLSALVKAQQITIDKLEQQPTASGIKQVIELYDSPEQPPITADLYCVCGAVWEWKNRSWELEHQPAGGPVAKDAEEWGNALNNASWAAVKAWDKELMGPMHGAIFNNFKSVVRAAILEYLRSTRHQPVAWVDLTDEEIQQALVSSKNGGEFWWERSRPIDFARAVIAKWIEKNGGKE